MIVHAVIADFYSVSRLRGQKDRLGRIMTTGCKVESPGFVLRCDLLAPGATRVGASAGMGSTGAISGAT
jgi:hypothetical protein